MLLYTLLVSYNNRKIGVSYNIEKYKIIYSLFYNSF